MPVVKFIMVDIMDFKYVLKVAFLPREKLVSEILDLAAKNQTAKLKYLIDKRINSGPWVDQLLRAGARHENPEVFRTLLSFDTLCNNGNKDICGWAAIRSGRVEMLEIAMPHLSQGIKDRLLNFLMREEFGDGALAMGRLLVQHGADPMQQLHAAKKLLENVEQQWRAERDARAATVKAVQSRVMQLKV